MRLLDVMRAGPAMTVQDLGRPGHMVFGLSQGGAADREAFLEGAALLGQPISCAAIEMAGFGGDFVATVDLRIALTGAVMKASLDGDPLIWNASHAVKAGQRVSIGAATSGVYGYLHIGGGIASESFLGSRSAHLSGGVGAVLAIGDALPIGPDADLRDVGNTLTPRQRFNGGDVRILPSVQTSRFSQEEISRFEKTRFRRTTRGNRQGVELQFEGVPFSSDGALAILSEPMVAGDVQMTGTGMPFVLLPECQTTGGYPRIGTVIPVDLPIVAQAAAGSKFSFRFVEYRDALLSHFSPDQALARLRSQVQPLVRDPRQLRDLLAYDLIGGVISAFDEIDRTE